MKPPNIECEPYDTISWAAYHLFDNEFYEKYKSDSLSEGEYIRLIDNCISHIKERLESRTFLEWRWKKYDRERLNIFIKMRQDLDN